MRGYTQLVHEQRYQIYALMKADHTQTEIAEILGVHKSTISRELRRNCGLRGYRPKQAHGLAMDRQANRATAHLSDSTWPLVVQPSSRRLEPGTNQLLAQAVQEYVY